MKRLEERVAPVLGPVAPHLVRKLCQGATNAADACRQLAAFIPSSRERDEFLAWARSDPTLQMPRPSRSTTPAPARTPEIAWDPAVLDRARSALAVHLGPLARVLVRRASTRAHDVTELYDLLALEIPSAVERERFRRTGPAAER